MFKSFLVPQEIYVIKECSEVEEFYSFPDLTSLTPLSQQTPIQFCSLIMAVTM